MSVGSVESWKKGVAREPAHALEDELFHEPSHILPIEQHDSNTDPEVRTEGQVAASDAGRGERAPEGLRRTPSAYPGARDAKEAREVGGPDQRGDDRAEEQRDQRRTGPYETAARRQQFHVPQSH